MSKLVQAAALAVVVSLPLATGAHGPGLIQSPATVSYYYPVSVQYVPVVAYAVSAVCVSPALPVYPMTPAVSAPASGYATPVPAPPSGGPVTSELPPPTPSPPAKPSAAPPSGSPGFGESTSFFDAYSVASKTAASSGRHGTVDFWNLTDRDLILRINSSPAQTLPRGKSVSVAVPRRFTWELQGRGSQTTTIERGDSALQIVIRR